MQDWNDLRFFLAVAEHGSTLAASVVCQTSQSTVFRRIASLEQSTGVTLFDRHASGYRLTSAGIKLLPLAQEAAAAMGIFGQAAASERRRQTTVIRFSAPDVTMEFLLPTIMGTFREKHPEAQVELIASDRKLDLAAGEADIALRTNPLWTDASLFGRRVAYERPMLAASKKYVDSHRLPATEAEFANHDFVSLTSNLSEVLGDWFQRNVPRHRIVLQPDTLASTLSAVRSGLGISVLPQFLCDRDDTLVAAPLALPVPEFELWIVCHKRLKSSEPVRSLMESIRNYIAATTKPRLSQEPLMTSAACP